MSSDLMKELSELQSKANKYDNMNGRYIELAKSINKAVEILKAVVTELDPISMKSERKNSGVDWEQVTGEFYLRMQQGTEVGTDMIEKTYPLFTKSQVSYILTKLAEKPNVDSRKAGKKKMMFCKKEFR